MKNIFSESMDLFGIPFLEDIESFNNEDLKKIMYWIDQEGANEPTEAFELLKLKVPLPFRKVQGFLYRGIGFDSWQIQDIKKNEGYYIGQDAESWTTDYGTAHRFALDSNGIIKMVMELKPNPSQIILNLGELLKDQNIKKRMKKIDPMVYAYINELDEYEVIIKKPKVKIKLPQKSQIRRK